MNKLLMLEDFLKWLFKLKDARARTHILDRIDRAKNNNFGDHKQLAENLYEMRIKQGAGYRLYYTKKEYCIYILIIGGDKSSQSKDIEKAKAMIIQLNESEDYEYKN